VRALRGRRARATRRALEELFNRGCEAAGYRLAGDDLEWVCCRHLYGSDRMLTAWVAADHVVVLAIGPHDRSASDVYDLLLEALGVDVPDEERMKPTCCDELGLPPKGSDAATAIVDAVENLAKQRRRRAR
jgi:hypothetical protein